MNNKTLSHILATLSLSALTLGAAHATTSIQPSAQERAAARVEAQRGGLTTPSSDAALQARLARCDMHKEDERKERCERRMREGDVSGSVAGGGVIRTLEETLYLEPVKASN